MSLKANARIAELEAEVAELRRENRRLSRLVPADEDGPVAAVRPPAKPRAQTRKTTGR